MSGDVRAGWPLTGADDLRDRLLAAWSQEHRRYHDLRHLSEVLERLELLGAWDDAVVLAAWFHDAIYDGERDDEERSALLAEEELAGLLPPEIVDEVARLVRLTATHRPEDDDEYGQALSDADLAILAVDESRYREYADAVRAEFADLDDATFATGRAAVLGDLLAKESIFHSQRARDLWEAAARANVEAELAELT